MERIEIIKEIELNIRNAEMRDIPQLLRMAHDFYEHGPFADHGLGFDPASFRAIVLHMLSAPQMNILLVSENVEGILNGTVAALASPWILNLSQVQFIEAWWWVDPTCMVKAPVGKKFNTDVDFRPAGIGAALLEAFEKEARDRGAANIKMGALPNKKLKAMDRFYRLKGFKLADTYYTKEL